MDQLFEKNPMGTNPGFIKDRLSTKPAPEYVLLQLARGLSYIHQRNLIFGNVKPENVLFFKTDVKQNVTVKWADFGLVNNKDKFAIADESNACESNNTEIFWRAPEWLVNDSGAIHNPTKESDIWLTGRLFYCYLNNGLPRWMKSVSRFYSIDLDLNNIELELEGLLNIIQSVAEVFEPFVPPPP